MIFYRGTRDFLDLNPESRIELRVPNTTKELCTADVGARSQKWLLGQQVLFKLFSRAS
jgi:hypothetical protein